MSEMIVKKEIEDAVYRMLPTNTNIAVKFMNEHGYPNHPMVLILLGGIEVYILRRSGDWHVKPRNQHNQVTGVYTSDYARSFAVVLNIAADVCDYLNEHWKPTPE